MKEDLLKVKLAFDNEIENVNDVKELGELRIKYLGKKGLITDILKKMSELNIEEKKSFGASLNMVKEEMTKKIDENFTRLNSLGLNEKLESERIDISLPSISLKVGSVHPLTKVTNTILDLFISLGYDVVSGPEVETDLYNFEMLNLPLSHPARDAQDSFYITDETLLRTQTSPVQIRSMLKNVNKDAIRIICPGKVYRRDNDDATHSHQFMQIEGLVVDKDVSLANLKGTLEVLAKTLFGSDRIIRFRPSFFPFTEPSVEVDVSCFKCGGEGCNVCKKTGWIEILGAGMVHPNVLKGCGYDTNIYRGFAFGIGIERIAMLKYGINDIRDLYTNDLRFLNNYNRIDGDK
ncbi:MAG: phenylalanine--tRNA ligase subunit alpha [Bacilli bacterium]